MVRYIIDAHAYNIASAMKIIYRTYSYAARACEPSGTLYTNVKGWVVFRQYAGITIMKLVYTVRRGSGLCARGMFRDVTICVIIEHESHYNWQAENKAAKYTNACAWRIQSTHESEIKDVSNKSVIA